MDFYDVWYDIFSYLDIKSKLALTLSNKVIKECNYPIYDIFYFRHLFLFGKSQIRKIEVSMGSQFNMIDHPNLIYLRSSISYGMSNLMHMKNLKTLKLGRLCAVSDYMIKDLDLVHLDIVGNPGITTVSHMKNLKVLRLNNNHSITQKTTEPLDLIELKLRNESFRFDLGCMKNLKVLSLRNSYYDFNDFENFTNTLESLKGLDLYCLSLKGYKVDDISFMKNLKYLKIESTGLSTHQIEKMNLLRNYENRKHIEYFYHDGALTESILYWKNILHNLLEMKKRQVCFLEKDIKIVQNRIKYLEKTSKIKCTLN